MVTASLVSKPRHAPSPRPAARVAVLSLALLLGSAPAAFAQSAGRAVDTWEVRGTSGGLIPTGAQRNALKDAQLSALQVSWLVRPALAVTGTFGWARSRDLLTIDDPKLDVFSYDLGVEARGSERFTDHSVTFAPFAGAGGGARSYNYRDRDVDATHNLAAYGSVGGEVGFRGVGLRLELRDYVTGFKPLTGRGVADTRNDVVVMLGVRSRKTAAPARQ